MIKLGSNSIGKIYLGSNSIGKAYLGSNLVFQKDVTPTPVTTVSYIRGGNNGSYIDTEITPDNTTKIVVWARNWNPYYTAYNWLCGARNAASSNAFAIVLPPQANIGKLIVCYGSNESFLENKWPLMSHYHKYELSADGFYVDDVLVSSVAAETFSSSYSIHLFGLNNGGSHSGGNVIVPRDICACKIYKNNVLVRDYTAVDTPSVGLYDAVSDTLFENDGTGSFTYGEFNSSAYTPLEYISCTGAQYFDSGVYGTYSLPIVLKMMPTNTTPAWRSILGERVSSPANACDFALGTASANSDNMRLYWRFGESTSSVNAFDGSTSNKLTNKEIVVTKTESNAIVYYGYSQIGYGSRSGVSSSFSTTYPMAVGTMRISSDGFSNEYFVGNFYYIGFGAEKNFVPAKVGTKVGMYDTYNDVFKESESGTPFVAGTTL